jgi:serine/threonine-protein kinase
MAKLCPACGTTYDDAVTFCPADGVALRPVGGDSSLVGAVINGRYLVTARLGEGGMGTVYLGRHVRLPQQVAIKVMRPELLADPTSLARFNREAANAASIEHDRVVRVYDFGDTEDGLVYLAMEYVPGRTLKEVVTTDGPLPPGRAAGLMRQVAEGVEAAHRLGIIHRDLKPDNILVVRDPDGTERCKVLDFGIARPVSGGETALTRSGYIVGTPEYMSPEQVLGGELDARSDVYALALVAYFVLTGDLPFDTATPDRGLTARLLQSPRPLQVVRGDSTWSAALQAVFDAALALEVEHRTGSALAFAQALADAASGSDREVAAPVPAPGPADAAPSPDAAPRAEAPSSPAPTVLLPPKAVGGDAQVPVPSAPPPRRWALPVTALAVVALAAGWWFAIQPAGGPPTPETPPAVAAPSGVASATADPVRAAPTAADPGGAPATPAPQAAPLTSGGGRSSGPRAAPTPAAPEAAGGATARQRLDALREQLDPATADEATARRLLPQLRAVIAELATPDDSTWGYIRLAEGYLLAGEPDAGCATLQRARAMARTMTQREAIVSLRGAAGCSP